ncbi:hypothetical protein AXFE_16280 [Acidithrix ferrooxidans]|uniref:Uncharacterized protein n=1 Tax=Acidithrix ferrooxidans TaxID=1280514 RepID=A0A0D8HHW0_9ACTN|nr:hypothetical protein AXFE_16280 [Acidithrix ferrooxidans]
MYDYPSPPARTGVPGASDETLTDWVVERLSVSPN